MAHGKPGYKCCSLDQERASETIRSEPSLTNIIDKRRILRSTHNLQSDAEYAPSQDTSQPPFLRIGQWPTRITPDLAPSSIALESHSVIRWTGTELQNEEINIGPARLRTHSDNQMHSEHELESGEVSLPHDASSSEHSALLEDGGQDLSHNYYQFEWFRILIGMMLLMVSEVIIFGLFAFDSVVLLWFSIVTSIAIGLFSLVLYAGIFVFLMEYHEAVGNFLNRYARLRPGLQHFCLRLCAYVYALGVIAVLGWWMFGFSVPISFAEGEQ